MKEEKINWVFIIFLQEEDDTLVADKEVTTCALLFEKLCLKH